MKKEKIITEKLRDLQCYKISNDKGEFVYCDIENGDKIYIRNRQNKEEFFFTKTSKERLERLAKIFLEIVNLAMSFSNSPSRGLIPHWKRL